VGPLAPPGPTCHSTKDRNQFPFFFPVFHGQKQRREREADAGHGERPRQRPIGDQLRRSCARARAHPHAVAARPMALRGGLDMAASGHGDRYSRQRWLRRLGAATKWRRGMGVTRCIPPPVALACPMMAHGNPATHAGGQGPQQPAAATFGGRIRSAGWSGRRG
jgi:hypothetical protein